MSVVSAVSVQARVRPVVTSSVAMRFATSSFATSSFATIGSTKSNVARLALTTVVATALMLTSTHSAAAQTTSRETARTSVQSVTESTTQKPAQQSASTASAWEFRVTSGAFVPTGSQRHALKDAQVTAAQLSWLVQPSLAVTGTFGWAARTAGTHPAWSLCGGSPEVVEVVAPISAA